MAITNLTVRTYDTYLIKKIESVIMNDANGKPTVDVIYSPYDLAFEYAMKRQQVKDKNSMKFPMIICHRTAGYTISGMTHRVLSAKKPIYYVTYLDETDVEVTRQVQVINVDIPYNIEIISKDENQAFELAQELLFLFIRDPHVMLPKYKDLSQVPDAVSDFIFTTIIDNDIADNTDLESESDIGKIFRVTLSVTINDAALTRDVTQYLVTSYEVNVDAVNE